jgi:hypothetical protein
LFRAVIALGIIEEIAKTEKEIKDFKEADDLVKFEVYKLTLDKLFETLGKNPTSEYLEEVNKCLDTMMDGFYILINKGIIKNIDLNNILPIFIEASSFLKSALRKGEDSPDFFKYQGLCRWKINEFIQQLR